MYLRSYLQTSKSQRHVAGFATERKTTANFKPRLKPPVAFCLRRLNNMTSEPNFVTKFDQPWTHLSSYPDKQGSQTKNGDGGIWTLCRLCIITMLRNNSTWRFWRVVPRQPLLGWGRLYQTSYPPCFDWFQFDCLGILDIFPLHCLEVLLPMFK